MKSYLFDLNTWTAAIDEQLNMILPSWAATLIESVIVALIIITLYAVFAIALIYMERKVCGFFQCRLAQTALESGVYSKFLVTSSRC